MSVRTDASGRRWVAVEVEVPGTPEEVWQAIATGPGVSSWFVPTEIEERDGVPVSVTSHFGPGMDAVAKVTAWDPPRRFAAEGEWGPGAPPVATEWIVEGMAETESPRETRDIVWNLCPSSSSRSPGWRRQGRAPRSSCWSAASSRPVTRPRRRLFSALA